ncbi:Ppx/GppA phosphatase family protein [Pelobium manganitolerans]|uniref:Ppx/GppA phosphatase family protein n=1 Tax=Pelobium manganitolerans TaxID=1842495 RepID=UPI003FA35FC7
MTTKAVIDIGTNTFHLLIAEVDAEKNIGVVYKDTIAVKLGEGGVNKGYIAEEAYDRGINALLRFKEALDRHHVEHVKTTATAAVRGATNGQQFIAEVKAKTGIVIELIDGLQEATYIYEAVKGADLLSDETALIMDIGGGSVEFIICNGEKIFWKNSYLLGAARLLADYYRQESAIEESTITAMENHFANTLIDFDEKIKLYQPKCLIGTAGSYDSYASIIALRNSTTFQPDTTKSYPFAFEEFTALLNELIASSHQDRVDMEGLIPLRTDMILMASILTKYVLEITDIQKVLTCTYSLKEGLLLSAE